MGDRRIFELSEINDYNENDEFVLNQFNTKVDKKIKAKNLVSESTIRNEVDAQLQAHPEWRATVLDKSLEPIKMHDSMWDAVKGMPVNSANQIISDRYESDNEPYLIRESKSVGNRVEEEIVGVSVAWNQLFNPSNLPTDSALYSTTTYTANGVTFTKNNDGSFTIQTDANGATADTNVKIANGGTLGVLLTVGHKSLITGCQNGSPSTYCLNFKSTENVYGNGMIHNPISSSNFNFWIVVKQGTVITTPVKTFVNIFDLTLMFGSTIADYVYTLEQATAGSGIAWLKSYGYFTKEYYEYTAGGIKSVNTEGKKVVGFNKWDEVWELGSISDTTGENQSNSARFRSKNYIPALPNTTYYMNHPNSSARFIYYDADKNFISSTTAFSDNRTQTTPSNCYYIRFWQTGTEYNNDICINISDTNRNGEYEPYHAPIYPTSNIDLRGIPKLVNNKLVYDGDIYHSSGVVDRKYGIVDLGTLSWTYNDTYQFFVATLNALKITTQPYIVAQMYTYSGRGSTATIQNAENLTLFYFDNPAQLRLKNTAYTDAATFKTAMSGVYLVYELATPTTEQAKPYVQVQEVYKDGTEEWIDERDIPIPVGHNSKYYYDLKEKIEYQPDLAQNDGKYVIEQDDGKLDLTPLGEAVNPLIENKIDEALGLPNENGKYYFAGEVEGTSADYGWQKDNNAKVDGEYDDLVNGSSKQLLSKKYYEDNTPYLFRANPYESDRLDEEIVGCSLAWNQIAIANNTHTTNNVTVTRGSNNIVTLNGTANASGSLGTHQNVNVKANHVYLLAMNKEVFDAGATLYTAIGGNVSLNGWSIRKESSSSTAATAGVSIRCDSGTTFDNVVAYVFVSNLTLAFGSTIADYAYSLEQATAGSGITWLKSQGFFNKNYYSHNAGSIESVKTSAKKVVGFNQWDEQWESGFIDASTGQPIANSTRFRAKNFTKVFPSTTYYVFCGNNEENYVYRYDAKQNYLGRSLVRNTTIGIPENTHYIKIAVVGATTYNHDICINIHGDKDGTYEPYVEHIYPLDSDLELRGIPKLVDGKIKYDGDVCASDGKVTRKYGIVDLGTLTWGASGSTQGGFYATIPSYKYSSNTIMICGRYLCDGVGNSARGYYVNNKTFRYYFATSGTSYEIYIYDTSYSNAATFKTAMSGVYLIYELTTPTTETASPYKVPQITGSTEEFIDEREVPIPVGHNSKYMYNIREKIEQLYGIPKPPTTNGIYKLIATVTASGIEYSWVTN